MKKRQGKVGPFRLRAKIVPLLVILSVLLGVVATLATRAPAKADTGGYPYASMACVWAPYATTGKGYWCSGYDWGTIHDDSSSRSVMSPYGYDYRNCTDFVAWKVASLGVSSNQYRGLGNANQWAAKAPGNGLTVNTTPAVGAAAVGTSGTFGHVAFISGYNSSTGVITIQEYNRAYDGNYSTPRSGTLSGLGFSKVVHFEKYETGGSFTPSTPSAVSRADTNMTVFYNDGLGGLASRSWDVNLGWSSYTWHDTFGTDGKDVISGQPSVVARDSSDMDVFYRTAAGRLIHRGWSATYGWNGPDVLLSSGVVGDPASIARSSGDLQTFFRTSASEIKSISWNWQSGWNLNPQMLYSSGATSEPVAVSRTPDSMDVFFGKNNGNLVHLGWTAAYGWNIADWTAGSGVTGRPTAITRNGGGDMVCFYQELNNGRIAAESWNWQSGWAWQDWTAQLVGSPSAVVGPSNVMDVFYRETGGNIVDRYFTGYTWASTWIVGPSSATGNPFALVRGSNLEVFYWNASTLMDAHWDATNGWRAAPVG